MLCMWNATTHSILHTASKYPFVCACVCMRVCVFDGGITIPLISGCLSHRGRTKNQTDQSNSPYLVIFQYCLYLISQFGFLFFHDGTSNLNLTI